MEIVLCCFVIRVIRYTVWAASEQLFSVPYIEPSKVISF